MWTVKCLETADVDDNSLLGVRDDVIVCGTLLCFLDEGIKGLFPNFATVLATFSVIKNACE